MNALEKAKSAAVEAKKKGAAAAKRAREAAKDRRVRDGAAAVGANVALGLAGRWKKKAAGDKIAKGRKTSALSRDEQIAYAAARASAELPHIGVLGEAGTWGAVALIAGAMTGQRDLQAAGVGLVGTEAYIRARGDVLVDNEAAKLQGGTAVSAATVRGVPDAEDEDLDLSGEDDGIDAEWYESAGDDDDDSAEMMALEAHLAGASDEDVEALADLAGEAEDAALIEALAAV